MGLAQGVLIQEAQLLAEHTEDQAPDQLVNGIVEQAGHPHGQQRHQNDLGDNGVGGVVLIRQRGDQLLAGSGGVLGRGGTGVHLERAGVDLGLDALGLALQAQGGDGVTHEALGAHDQGGEHRQVRQVGFVGHILHGQGGDNAAGENGRAHQSEAAVDDQLADEEHGSRDADAGHGGDDDGAPLGAEVTELDGGAQMHQQHGDQQTGHAQQGGIGEHGGGEYAGPEARQKHDGGDQQHGYDGFCLGGDHISYGEHHEDDSR